jgi:Ca-activated chloride channel family protein
LTLLAIAWLLAITALAGPVWRQQPQPVFSSTASRVLVLDLSDSMLDSDLAPSRLQRTRYKLRDLLEKSQEGRTGLVVFSGDAHVVTPLTDDVRTIAAMLPSLSPEIMPIKGDDAGGALELAKDLLVRGGEKGGEILLISDGIGDGASVMDALAKLRDHGIRISVLAIAHSKADTAVLEQVARSGGGAFNRISGTDSDIENIVESISTRLGSNAEQRDSTVERWYEEGPLLILPLLVLAALGARRGWLFVVLLLLAPQQSQAMEWQRLWQRNDQRAAEQMAQGNTTDAAELFSNRAWRGIAQYENGDYEAAAENFASLESADGYYNQGNALARFGHLEEAVAAYDRAIELDPAMEDAKINRDLVQRYLEEQQQQQCNNPQEGEDGQESDTKEQPGDQGQNKQENTPQEEENDGKADQQKEQNPGDSEDAQGSPEPPQQDRGKTDSQEPQRDGRREADSKQEAAATTADKDDGTSQEPPQAAAATSSAQEAQQPSEEDLALEQWVRQVPDDPAGLLRRKFRLESERRRSGNKRDR